MSQKDIIAMKAASLAEQKNTPLMEQYFGIKDQYPDALLFFQVGDFYELFFEDAKLVASFLALTLTKRGKNKGEDIPLCGVPVHAASHYLAKLVRGGFKVVMCSQLEKPQPGTVVKRGVSQVFTPGTLIDDQLLDNKSASYLLALNPLNDSWGVVFSELLTAQLFATRLPAGSIKLLETELSRFSPDEIILPKTAEADVLCKTLRSMGYPVSFSQAFEPQEVAVAWVEQQLAAGPKDLLENGSSVFQTLQTLYWYLRKNQAASLPLFKNVHLYDSQDYLILDLATQKNLEILSDNNGSKQHSLYAVLDKAVTSMGSRTIKKWLQRPLVQEDSIRQRQEFIKQLLLQPMILMQLEEAMGKIADLERIIGRIALEKAVLRDYQALKNSLLSVPAIKNILLALIQAPISRALAEKIIDLSKLESLLQASINDDVLQPDTLIKQGFHHELDALRHLAGNAQQEILALEQRQIAQTGVGSLKVRFNNITGYYFEITDANASSIPTTYRHVQTLANRKRFTNDELVMLERNITRAQQETAVLEQEVFAHVKKEVLGYLAPLRNLTQSLAYTDALLGLAKAAYDQSYVQPTFNNNRIVDVMGGRHPVVERELSGNFIKNDVRLNDSARLIVLTGPNMGGKSTYLRQVALISIMAQMGSFIPATAGTLPIFDRIFTRIGSGDNLAQGKSTFLIEMEETATICTQATKNSLVILDEVGRGTSTYDGLALAQAIIEYLAGVIGVSCLFATHYHELTVLEKSFKSIKNYHAECLDRNGSIIFTHCIKSGATNQSFGIHVAELAAIPGVITARAKELLKNLNNGHQQELFKHQGVPQVDKTCSVRHEVAMGIVSTLAALDLNSLSPKDAFDFIWKLQKDCKM